MCASVAAADAQPAAMLHAERNHLQHTTKENQYPNQCMALRVMINTPPLHCNTFS
jgi:hypothetical protein